MFVELKFCVEAGAVRRHQVNAFSPGNQPVPQQHRHNIRAETLPLVLSGHNHIPKHGPINSITCSTAKTDQIWALPCTHNRLAAAQHPSQIS